VPLPLAHRRLLPRLRLAARRPRLAHGDVGTAIDRNPLAVLAVPLVVALWLLWARRRVLGRPRTWAAPAWVINALLVAVVAFWVLRNLGPFAWLAP
jgi:hypothetical protein